MSGTPTPTVGQSVAKIVSIFRPELRYSYPRTYAVRAVHTDGKLDLSPPPDAADELPPLNNVRQWTGQVAQAPAVGASVVVVFRDARQDRAVVVAFEPTTPGPAAARQGDGVVRMAQDPTTKLVYVAADPVPAAGHHYAALATTAGPPADTFPGTAVDIGAGSSTTRIAP